MWEGYSGKLLTRDFDIVHISVGDIFRWNIQSHTKLAARIRRIVDSGALVPDDIVEEIVIRRLAEHDWNYGFILDGFPRNRRQAEFFLESYDVDAVIHIEVPDATVLTRVMSRRLCPACNLDYNLIHHRPAVENACDVCQGELSLRSDDTEEALGARLAEYHEKIEPILEFFRTKELVLRVEGAQSAEDVQADILQWLAVDPEQGQSRSRYFCD